MKYRFVAWFSWLLLILGSSVSWSQNQVNELGPARTILDSTGFAGTILVYDLENGSYQAGHSERVDRRLIPASTFKIFNALVAIETGVIEDCHEVIKWDGVTRGRTEINRDLDLQSAFRVSAVPHFQFLARTIGPVRMKDYLKRVGYGNGDISGGIDTFWLSGGLRISVREQVDFLTRLYNGALPFSSRAMDEVKEMMVVEQTPEYTIQAKTGWAVLGESDNFGWWVGWVRHPAGTHFFATVLETDRPGESFGPARIGATRRVLEALEVLPPSEYGN